MPEGDTIHRSARTLARLLTDREVRRAESTARAVQAVGLRRLVGQTVARVEARGKHLLIWFAPSGLALHTHMRMTGSWHVYAPGERWRRPPHLARFILEVPEAVAVCFSAPVCELLSPGQVERHPSLARLGPDPLEGVESAEGTPGDDEELLRRARERLDARAEEEIGVALLDQAVLAGVGNVYRTEVLFLHGVNPWTKVGDLEPAQRDALLTTATRLLRLNVAPGTPARITTTGGPRGGPDVSVHGRGGRPCPRCATLIRVDRQGPHGRLTYWCPSCQGAGPTRPR